MAHLDGVAVDDGPVLLEVLWGEAALVDDLHLLHDGALPRLTRTWDQKFYNPLIFFLTKKSRNSLSVKEAMIGTGVWGWRKNREKQQEKTKIGHHFVAMKAWGKGIRSMVDSQH